MIHASHHDGDLARPFRAWHFVGIGGAGMSGIAESWLRWVTRYRVQTRATP